MKLTLNKEITKLYRNHSQKIRVASEEWVSSEVYCPACGNHLQPYERNRPVNDFFCISCREDFELKSKKTSFGNKIVDGAYNTMIQRLKGSAIPNLFLLNYDASKYEVVNFIVIPKQFFIPELIEKRKPLALTAKRAGWVGCTISLQEIPKSGRISIINNKNVASKSKVMELWKKTLFLREEKLAYKKGWIFDIMRCIDAIGKREFSLDEIYYFEEQLKLKYPTNRHIKAKIRQQLQILRDQGYLEFIAKGKYKVA